MTIARNEGGEGEGEGRVQMKGRDERKGPRGRDEKERERERDEKEGQEGERDGREGGTRRRGRERGCPRRKTNVTQEEERWAMGGLVHGGGRREGGRCSGSCMAEGGGWLLVGPHWFAL